MGQNKRSPGSEKEEKGYSTVVEAGRCRGITCTPVFVGNLYFAPSSNFPQKNDPQFVTTDSTETRQEERIAQPNSDQDSVNDAVGSNMDQEAEKTAKTVQNQAKRPLNRAFLLPKRFQLPIQIPPTAKTNPQQIRFIIQKRLRKQ